MLDRPLRLVDALGARRDRAARVAPRTIVRSVVPAVVRRRADARAPLGGAAACRSTRAARVVGWIVRGRHDLGVGRAGHRADHRVSVPAGRARRRHRQPRAHASDRGRRVAARARRARARSGWRAAGPHRDRRCGRCRRGVDRGAGALARVTPVGTIAVATAGAMAVLVALSLLALTRARRRTAGARCGSTRWRGSRCALAWTARGHRRQPAPCASRSSTSARATPRSSSSPTAGSGSSTPAATPARATSRAAAAPGGAVSRALAGSGHTAIDLAILSHPHPDHYLGFAALDVPIARAVGRRGDARRLRDEPRRSSGCRCRVRRGRARPAARASFTRRSGSARRRAGVELVGARAAVSREPTGAPRSRSIDPVRTVNDNSLVVELRYRGRRYLFAGDVEAEGEDALVAAGLGAAEGRGSMSSRSRTTAARPRRRPAFVAATRPALARDLVRASRTRSDFRPGGGRAVARRRGGGRAHRPRRRDHRDVDARAGSASTVSRARHRDSRRGLWFNHGVVTPARDREAMEQAVVRGSEQLKQGRLDEAQAAFRAALARDRDNPRMLALLGLDALPRQPVRPGARRSTRSSSSARRPMRRTG